MRSSWNPDMPWRECRAISFLTPGASRGANPLQHGDWSEIRELKPDILAELRGGGLRNSGATP